MSSKVIGTRIPDELDIWLREQAQTQKKTVGQLLKDVLEGAMNGDGELVPTTTAQETHSCSYCGMVVDWGKVKTDNVDFGDYRFRLVKKCPACKRIVYVQSDKVFELQTKD